MKRICLQQLIIMTFILTTSSIGYCRDISIKSVIKIPKENKKERIKALQILNKWSNNLKHHTWRTSYTMGGESGIYHEYFFSVSKNNAIYRKRDYICNKSKEIDYSELTVPDGFYLIKGKLAIGLINKSIPFGAQVAEDISNSWHVRHDSIYQHIELEVSSSTVIVIREFLSKKYVDKIYQDMRTAGLAEDEARDYLPRIIVYRFSGTPLHPVARITYSDSMKVVTREFYNDVNLQRNSCSLSQVNPDDVLKGMKIKMAKNFAHYCELAYELFE